MVYPLTGRLLSRERNDVRDTPQHGGTLDVTPTLKPTRYATPLTPHVPNRRIHGDRAAQPCGAGRRGDRETARGTCRPAGAAFFLEWQKKF